MKFNQIKMLVISFYSEIMDQDLSQYLQNLDI
jgi:hypothetical protein